MGSHSSMRISESLEGVRVAATRQKAGRFCMALVEPGAVNDPPVMVCADVILVFGKESDARFSHVAAVAVVAGRAGSSTGEGHEGQRASFQNRVEIHEDHRRIFLLTELNHLIEQVSGGDSRAALVIIREL